MSNNNSEEQTFRLGELVSLLNFNGAIINNNNYILLIDFIFTVMHIKMDKLIAECITYKKMCTYILHLCMCMWNDKSTKQKN